ncbi:chemotaxis protein CheW [Oxalobacteraceae bacterium]|nr:chemotaxis protein CheW [Oxalobacteraceae bacterium]
MATPVTDTSSAPDGSERRSRLRQYQVQLLERMQAAKSGAAAAGRELGVLVGERRCLLDLTQVSEIVPLQPLAQVPLTQDWYLGLANIRGNLTGVIDLARYMGGPVTPVGAEQRLVNFAPGLQFNCALLVGRVLGLRRLDEMDSDAAAGLEAQDAPWCEQHFLDHDGQRWTRIDLAELVKATRFLQVGL